MGMEVWSKANTVPFLIGGSPQIKYITLLQQGQRSGDMLTNTLLGRVGATGLYQQITPGNSDGSQLPRAILRRSVTEAELQAGNVVNVPAWVGGAEAITVDKNQLVIEGATDLDTNVNLPAGLNSRVEDLMIWANMYVADTKNIEVAQEPTPPI
jgi:hypothetical protein